MQAGLVDEIGSLDASVRRARELAGLSSARVVTYHRPREYTNNYYTRAPRQRATRSLDLWPDELPRAGPRVPLSVGARSGLSLR